MTQPMKITLIGASGFYAFDIYRRAFSDERMRPVELRIWNRNAETGESIGDMLTYLKQVTGYDVNFGLYSDRKEALQDADFVLFTSCVDYPRVRFQDLEVCEKFGLNPLEVETMTPGGLMNTFRHLPILLGVAEELKEVSPDAWIIPVVNPLARECDALNRYTNIKFIGHCDGIVHTRFDLSTAMGRNPKDVEVVAAGVNHLTFILKMWDKTTGEDLLPYIDGALPNIRQNGPFGFRFSNMVYKLLGYYPSPGDNHIADQLPFVSRQMQDEIPIPSLNVIFPPREDIHAGKVSNSYAAKLAGQRIKNPEVLQQFLHPSRYEESGDWMEALLGRKERHHVEAVNIPNDGLITNLPRHSIVEVPAVIDPGGVHGYGIGDLPMPLASVCLNMLVAHESAVDAYVNRDREAAIRSLAFEPTVNDLSICEDLFDALLDANVKYLDADFVADLKDQRQRSSFVNVVAPSPDNPMTPWAPQPEGSPGLDVVVGSYWGGESGNLSDTD
jgi:alpha-galactosidase